MPKTLNVGPASIIWSSGVDGHLGLNVDSPPRVYVEQVHGIDDLLVTNERDVALTIKTADCASIALVSDNGVIGAVHAGWRGLELGVIGNAASRMRELGASDIKAALGPCIHVECYEFGSEQLAQFVEHWGESVRNADHFDLPAAVSAECEAAGIDLVYSDETCTACDTSYFSYRARKDEDRQVMLIWT